MLSRIVLQSFSMNSFAGADGQVGGAVHGTLIPGDHLARSTTRGGGVCHLGSHGPASLPHHAGVRAGNGSARRRP
jgi:hypothetical protein